ncbi:maleylpyruvate isomerase N-terminal domain-containing protein [Lewinella cohaerens]|uniref:maleylpyruvate isomerase N-terminal domain-containing protein n=1 Tax=Lewinella cohaerens TaxID=70995 RepID=UPI000371E82A|nr:maleylpyruvate isomerase N-terminal domain-containing protein [Lewinella cohaerens]
MSSSITNLVHKLPALNEQLLTLLKSLSAEEWQAQTVASQWKVKDVVAHLLDGNIRILSMLRDGYQGETADIASYQDLVVYINRLNADWVQAMKRVSPEILILLHELTGPLYNTYYASLDPFEKAAFSVAWAGEEESKNWMHIAREYTEKFLHQQQIRDAVQRPGIMTTAFFLPFVEVCLKALPHTFREVPATDGTCIQLSIPGACGGRWFFFAHQGQWQIGEAAINTPITEVTITAEAFWKLVSKSKRAVDLEAFIEVKGDPLLAEKVLSMVSFIT